MTVDMKGSRSSGGPHAETYLSPKPASHSPRDAVLCDGPNKQETGGWWFRRRAVGILRPSARLLLSESDTVRRRTGTLTSGLFDVLL